MEALKSELFVSQIILPAEQQCAWHTDPCEMQLSPGSNSEGPVGCTFTGDELKQIWACLHRI